MNERDERAERDKLATVIETAYDLNPGMASFELLAHAVLAAGYRRPRIITTVEELDELPNGTILLASDRYPRYRWTLWRVKTGGMIEQVGHELKGVTPFRYFKDPLPATVLHEPEATK